MGFKDDPRRKLRRSGSGWSGWGEETKRDPAELEIGNHPERRATGRKQRRRRTRPAVGCRRHFLRALAAHHEPGNARRGPQRKSSPKPDCGLSSTTNESRQIAFGNARHRVYRGCAPGEGRRPEHDRPAVARGAETLQESNGLRDGARAARGRFAGGRAGAYRHHHRPLHPGGRRPDDAVRDDGGAARLSTPSGHWRSADRPTR